ncbi:MAG: hypothetical protein VX599_08485 [Pseudomonadota bacterium]|nr:hypothetical protein [Pseudomonadota bacterium]
MSAKDRTPNTRLLALAALIIAAGLLALRAYDVFGAQTSESVGSPIERQLTYLLEPVTGNDRVRVSVSEESPRQVLIMVDGKVASDLRPLRARVEDVLIASIAFDPETDSLKLSQFPFAPGVGGTLTSMQIAEMSGLSLLTLTLLGILFGSNRSRTNDQGRTESSISASETRRAAPLQMPVAYSEADLTSAGKLAETKPNETASLVRGWLSYAED